MMPVIYHYLYKSILLLLLLGALFTCDSNTSPNQQAPGEPLSTRSEALETGAELLQNHAPVNQLSMYLDGFHFTNGDMDDQMEAHHYCTQMNEDISQCIIYDGNTPDAHIIGIEYIISERLFSQLPEAEKSLWHSHRYEIKSGQLIAPGIPGPVEKELMEKMVSTYGKTWHTWHTHAHDSLPLGTPQLMMGFTSDGQVHDSLVRDRDRRFDIYTGDKKEARKDLPSPEIQQGADAWQEGNIKQLPALTP